MCRLFGYLGPAVTLDTLLYAPEHSLERQAFAPRHQVVGRINADGWGVGWYDPSIRREPARYRTATPIWADQRFKDIAPLVRAGVVVGAVRNASPGAPVEETGSSPFVAGPYLFTHNGFVSGFREGLGVQLRRGLSERRDAGILGAADSEVVFAMVLDRLDKGLPMVDALGEVTAELLDLTTGCFNFLLTDGDTIVATRVGNSLFGVAHDRSTGSGTVGTSIVIASEPWDDDPGWAEVPDRSLLVARVDGTFTRTAL